MPYIDPERAKRLRPPGYELDTTEEYLKPGDVAWAVSEDVTAYLRQNGVCFETLNAMVGVLENVKSELRLRLIDYYEQKKLAEGGADPFEQLTMKLP